MTGKDAWFQARVVAYDTPEGVRIVWLVRNVTEQKQAEEEIRTLNALLEQRVQKRTNQLQTANEELEAFSYSVSHDLRAPLRAVDGYSTMLKEGYAYKLDAEGKRYLAQIQNASQRMGLLIDDLLELSRLSRKEPQRILFSLSDLAKDIVVNLQTQESDRQIEISIQPDLEVVGDPSLLRVALDNLLGNAWKFTNKQSQPKISFGSMARKASKLSFL
ncbi:MAG: hypothetical protein HC806_04670 [Anaerolineae bacterium]|nr:hypothetical protein [Anaerolineae bacterium]